VRQGLLLRSRGLNGEAQSSGLIGPATNIWPSFGLPPPKTQMRQSGWRIGWMMPPRPSQSCRRSSRSGERHLRKILSDLPYAIAYEIVAAPEGGEMVAILHVIHGVRDWRLGNWPAD
jgi:hypothetical protein